MRLQVSSASKRSVVVVGVGNIGSHLVSHLARLTAVDRVTLIDCDVYDRGNLHGQDIAQSDFGKRKVHVQARRLRAINPDLELRAIPAKVEMVPLALLRADVILACVDSRRARQLINEAAWRLNVPWIDAGVLGASLLARINVYVPSHEDPCLECAWGDSDYQHIEQIYPCALKSASSAATNASSAIGALAASLQAIECQKLLEGSGEHVAVGRQVLIDVTHHKHYVTSYSRNPSCRFDHEVWKIQKLNGLKLTLAKALEVGRTTFGVKNPNRPSLRIGALHFVRRVSCSRCGNTKSLLRLEASLRPAELKCGHCGGEMLASGFDHIAQLNSDTIPEKCLGQTLRGLGLRLYDVLSLSDSQGDKKHYEITDDLE